MAKERNGFNGEYKFYVGVVTQDCHIRFVDSVDYCTKSATWKAGSTALAMDKQSAIQLQMGLMCNGSVALVIEVPDFQDLRNQDSYD